MVEAWFARPRDRDSDIGNELISFARYVLNEHCLFGVVTESALAGAEPDQVGLELGHHGEDVEQSGGDQFVETILYEKDMILAQVECGIATGHGERSACGGIEHQWIGVGIASTQDVGEGAQDGVAGRGDEHE